MSDVTLDGENVSFAGASPASFSAVRTMLEEALATRGRVLASLSIGDQPFDESLGDEPLPAGARIEATSLALADAVAQVGASLVPEIETLRTGGAQLACEVLRAPWPEIQPRCVHFIEAATAMLQRAIEVAALGGEHSPATDAVAALAASLEAGMHAVQRGDAADLALELDGTVTPALTGVTDALTPRAIP